MQPFKVFQRIGLHLRRKWAKVDIEGTASLVVELSVFDDIDLHHEYFHLLHEHFGNFSPKIQQAYLTLITKGPGQRDDERYMRHWRYAKLWDVLSSLADDPEPTPKHEQRYGGSNMDPATLSINTTRGNAMHAVVRYALWVRRHIELTSYRKEHIKQGFEEMPEVREILDYHLKPSHDPALAIRDLLSDM